MALLDRFRTHPGHKNPDAAVRLQFVQEIAARRARSAERGGARRRRSARAPRGGGQADGSGGARRASPGPMRDEQVRAQALSMLRDIALEAFEGLGESDSLAAVAAIEDAEVAGRRRQERVARGDGASRAGARHRRPRARIDRAARASTRACGAPPSTALQDHGELLGVALNSEFKDPTLAAVERITDRAELEQIAARAKNKSASKRARAMVREMDERLAADDQAARDAAAAALTASAEPDPAEIARAAQDAAARQAIQAQRRGRPRRGGASRRARHASWRRGRAPSCASGSRSCRARRRSTSSRWRPPSGKGCRRSTTASPTTS